VSAAPKFLAPFQTDQLRADLAHLLHHAARCLPPDTFAIVIVCAAGASSCGVSRMPAGGSPEIAFELRHTAAHLEGNAGCDTGCGVVQ